MAAGEFPAKQAERALFPTPPDGATVGINPPGFAWWRAPGAAAYRLVILDSAGRQVYEAGGMADPVHLPSRVLPPGEYAWDVEALDKQGRAIASRGRQRFTIPSGVPELPWEDLQTVLGRVPASHPRLIFLAKDLPRIRESLSAGRKQAWEALKRAADRALSTKLPQPPQYHTFTGENRARMGYAVYFRNFRSFIDQGMSTLALAYLLSGDQRYGLAAKKILLEVAGWGVEGPMSLLAPWGDEPGLSMSRHGHRAYDWLYPLLDETERASLRDHTIDRARQILRRLRRADYLATPAESHNGRLICYLSEYAIVLKGEAPEAAEWLDYSLRALTTFYPHWGGVDGGWAEGLSYAMGYNGISLTTLEALRAATGVDLWKRPFFDGIRRYFLYCAAPNGEMKPFGDGADRPGVGAAGVLMRHYGRRLNDPACVWWAEQASPGESGELISLITEDKVAAAPPWDHPGAAVFRGIGRAALHSALDDPAGDTFLLLKSSPYGSVSHSHADQNSFAILKGGRALAIPSGHYGPAYGMPHHADWTRQTKANNCVLVNGEGQVVRDFEAKGRIAGFEHGWAITYVCGDAAAAYKGKLARFLRHIVFVRPGLFLVLDDLAAPSPATFQWLLHAFDKMEVDEARRQVVSRRGPASLTVRLHAESPLAFSQTDQFDTPYNTGNPPEYQEQMPNHWHFTAATTAKAAEQRIAAVMLVQGAAESFKQQWVEHPGWTGASVQTLAGIAEVWGQTKPGAPGPKTFREVADGKCPLAARWRPARGRPELFLLGQVPVGRKR